MNYLVVVAGPTAVGKTSLAIELAKKFNSEIISADSRQFYKEITIGTAKPTIDEMDGVMHHFVNSHSIHEDYNAGKFEKDVIELLPKLFAKNQTVFLVGGSGMYIKAVTEGLDDLPEKNDSIRNKYKEILEKEGIHILQQKLKDLDPEYYLQIDIFNSQRLIRAIEIIEVSGKTFSQIKIQNKKKRTFEIIKIGINLERKFLYQRIDNRMDAMLRSGLLKEAKSLFAFKEINALQTVGYKEIFDFINGIQSWEETVALLKRNSRRYAKRQLTWFHGDQDYKWFEPNKILDITAYIQQKQIDY